jgi:hypothetical protein
MQLAPVTTPLHSVLAVQLRVHAPQMQLETRSQSASLLQLRSQLVLLLGAV